MKPITVSEVLIGLLIAIPGYSATPSGKLAEMLAMSQGMPLLAKVTYVGPQDHPVPSLLLFDSRLPDDSDFLDRFSATNEIHPNDVIAALQRVSMQDGNFRQLLAEIEEVASDSRAKSLADAKVAFTVARATDDKSDIQLYFDRRTTRRLLVLLSRYTADDVSGLQRVDAFRSQLGFVR